ncbi:Cationic amino acid transporter 1 [Platanthera guangdongensis]|uniref:Cationic amino acid transporter 1 n=1 Tax=Platanthera guangdongensis TaxID=2320717 RepID=A0ABR2MSA0_9ASPA
MGRGVAFTAWGKAVEGVEGLSGEFDRLRKFQSALAMGFPSAESGKEEDEQEIQTSHVVFFHLARSWTSYFATVLNHHPKHFRIHSTSLFRDYFCLNPIARGIFSASTILFFTCVGFDTISTMIDGTRNPAKDIPFGLVNTMPITTARYVTYIAYTHMMSLWVAAILEPKILKFSAGAGMHDREQRRHHVGVSDLSKVAGLGGDGDEDMVMPFNAQKATIYFS